MYLCRRRMPCTSTDCLQTAGNLTLFSLLCIWLLHSHLRTANCYFMAESKAEFLQGCGDYWTMLEPVPLLTQMTVCMEVRVLSPGPWTAFSYSTPHSPIYDLALRGDKLGLEVWLLGVKHHFPVLLPSHRWHHICLRRGSHSFRLEVDGWSAERTFISRAIPPGGELLLGCRGARRRGAGRMELYLFRMWEDLVEHGICEDGGVVRWDSRQWAVAGTAKARDYSLSCSLKRVKREVAAWPAISLTPASTPTSEPVSSGNTTVSATASTPVSPEPTANNVTDVLMETQSNYSDLLVKCNFSQFCADDRAYYWMSIAVETSEGQSNESEISSWLSGLFGSNSCVTPTQSKPSTEGLNSTTSSSEESGTHLYSGSVTASNGPTTASPKVCGTWMESSVSQLQGIEVDCDGRNQTRTTQCNVLLQLSLPMDTCVLSQVLREGGANGFIRAYLLGEVERVGKGLCLSGEELHPDGRFVKCNSSAPLSEVCSTEGPANITCHEVETVNTSSVSQLCSRQEQSICDCSAFCGDPAVYYTLLLNVTSPTLSMTDIQNTMSQLSSPSSCSASDIMTQDLCLLLLTISKLYQGVHLECHGTDTRLHSCMAMVKLAKSLAACSVSAVLSHLFQNNSAVYYDGLVTQAAICGWSSEPAANLLDSNFTWVSTDLTVSQICGALDPIILTCQEGETLSVLLNESCQDPLQHPTISTEIKNIANNTTPDMKAFPISTTEYNTPAFPMSSTQNTTTPYNTVIIPMNTTQYNTTFPLNVTQYNGTALPWVTEMPTTTVLPEDMTHLYITYPDTNSSNSVGITAVTGTTTTLEKGLTSVAVTMTTASIEYKMAYLLNQTQQTSTLNTSMVEQVVSDMEGLLSGPNISLAMGRSAVAIVSNLLHVPTAILASVSTRIIRIVDTMGLKLVIPDKIETISSDSLALAVTKIDASNFTETSFFISDSLQINVSSKSSSSTSLGSITLPPSLAVGLTQAEKPLASRIQFNYYLNGAVFQDKGLESRKLNSGVLGTSVANLSISGLKDNVVFTLRNTKPARNSSVCVFWDFSFNGGSGGWNQTGCNVQNATDEATICSCNHLTSFAVLLDISREGIQNPVQDIILTFITYIGCGISAIFLAVTLLTYLAFEKLRGDIPSKILIQLCLALLLLNLVFLLDSWLALYPHAVGLCISTAFFLHYFLLVSFTWMGLDAFHMYLALVKVFNNYFSRYMLKFSVVGWGLPLIVVIIVIAINKDNYGLVQYRKYTNGSTDDFCWLKNNTAFYVAVVAYFCLVFLVNLVMFVVVLVQLQQIKRRNPHNSEHQNVFRELRNVAGLTFLLGLTWGFAFFAWGPANLPFMYLFAIFNSLQGFFIFIFHCAIKENVRQQWRTYLCCGSLRRAENSEWSRTATQSTTVRNHSIITVPSNYSTGTVNSSQPSSNVSSTGQANNNDRHAGENGRPFLEQPNENISRQRSHRLQ